MDWKDTVMTGKQIYEIGAEHKWFQGCSGVPQYEIELLKAQAEISFKAGEDKGYAHARQHCEDVIIPQAEADARREVVEFVSNLIIGIDGCTFEERLDGDKGCIVLDMNENQWQTKLKTWGIKEDKQ